MAARRSGCFGKVMTGKNPTSQFAPFTAIKSVLTWCDGFRVVQMVLYGKAQGSL